MNLWKSMVGGLAVAALVTGAPMQVFAHDRVGHIHEFIESLEEKLDLRKEQKDELKALHESMKEQRKALKKQGRALRKQIKEAIKSGANQNTLDNLGAQLGKVQVSKMQMIKKHSKAFEKILDDEQKAKFEAMKAEKKKRWKEKHEGMDDDDDD